VDKTGFDLATTAQVGTVVVTDAPVAPEHTAEPEPT
jgi:hypothetical protein